MGKNNSNIYLDEKKKILVGIISIFLLICFAGGLICLVINSPKSDNNNEYYLTETLNYDGIDVTVNKVDEKISNNDTGGSILLTINFTLKNNKKKDFKFSYDNFYIKAQSKGQKYEYTAKNASQVLFSKTIIAGGSSNYDILFYVPYSMTEENYILFIDWGWTHKEQHFYLYNRAIAEGTLEYTISDNSDYYIVSGIGGLKETNITIPDFFNNLPIKKIGVGALENSENIISISMGNNIEQILDNAFKSCINLTSVTLSNSLKEIGGSVFENCFKLERITIPENITTLQSYLFKNCTSLNSVKLHNGIKVIKEGAFYNCGIKEINIPSQIKKIYPYTFCNCFNLETINMQNVENIEIRAFQKCIKLKNVIFSENLLEIGAYCFEECISLTTLTIPNSCKSINKNILNDCINITNLTLPNINFEAKQNSGYYTKFYYPIGYIFGNSNYQYNSYYELTNQTFNTYTAYHRYEEKTENFSIPKSLTNLTITKSLTYGALSNCNNITRLNLSEGIESIPTKALSGCSGLESLVIPLSINWIGVNAFSECFNLLKIEFKDYANWEKAINENWESIDLSNSKQNAITLIKINYKLRKIK